MARTPRVAATVLVGLVIALLAFLVPVAAKPMPQMPKGLPKGLGRGGPPWRKAIDEALTDACSMNKGRPSVFCFPDKDKLLAAMQVEQYGLDMTSETFAHDVLVVVNQLLAWIPGWSTISDVLSPSQPWTESFCEKIIGGGWFRMVPMFRKSFIVPSSTMGQLRRDLPLAYELFNKWIENVKLSGNSHTQKLLKEMWAVDEADTKNRTVHPRPMMRLMQQVHSKMVLHIFTVACKGNAPAKRKFVKTFMNNMTALHHLATLGDTAGVKAVMKVVPKQERFEFVNREDEWGYRAEDWARLADFPDTVEALHNFAKKGGKKKGAVQAEEEAEETPSSAPREPVKLFKTAINRSEAAEEDIEQCPADASAEACADKAAIRSGGWNVQTDPAFPLEWLPPMDQPCFADTIDVSQFDAEVFLPHYLLHGRPLLIRGAGKPPADLAFNYTREGLLDQAGERRVETLRFPSEHEIDGTKPEKRTLSEYVEYMSNRGSGDLASRLHYLYTRLQPEESYINFTAKVPSILEGLVDHVGTNFYLGGVLHGVPPHHHGPTLNSLIYGRKMWFLDPPGKEVVVHDTMYEWLRRSGGAPESQRCMQEAGDIFFVPRSWTHATICVSDCVAASQEISSPKYDLRD